MKVLIASLKRMLVERRVFNYSTTFLECFLPSFTIMRHRRVMINIQNPSAYNIEISRFGFAAEAIKQCAELFCVFFIGR